MEESFKEELYNDTLTPISVILVDDHPLMREGIVSVLAGLSKRVHILGSASSYDDFFKLLKQTGNPDIAVLDIIMPGKTGIDIAIELKRRKVETRILMLSSDNSEITVIQAVNAGVEGFISKSSPSSELINAIETIADGGTYFGSDISRMIESFDEDGTPDRRLFTKRELQIVDLCCEGLTSRAIAQKLNISIRTVETHKNNIFRHMNINSSTELVKLALAKHLIQL
jgi:two-component system nitrate/nitrite response regulator NarL